MVDMKHFLAPLLLFCSLLIQPFGLALVPGPILLSDEQLDQLQQDSERQLTISTTRAKAACLSVAQTRFCPGIPAARALELWQQLPPAAQKRTLIFNDGKLFKGVLALLPEAIKLPPPRLGADAIPLGPEPVALATVTEQLGGLAVRQPFVGAFSFKVPLTGLAPEDLSVWYYGETHLGLLTHSSGQGEYVIGAFVSK